MDSLRRVLTPPVTTTPAPAPVSSPVTSPPGPIYSASPMVNPAPCSGSADDCNGFLLQCSLALEMQPHRFPAERAKISFILSLLTGRALQWAESLWKQNGTATQSLNAFTNHFREVFGRPVGDASVSEKLYHLKQGKTSVQDYALRFRTLSASSGWNERSLLTTYRQGLEPSLRLHLSAYDDTLGLERFIQLSIRVANRIHGCMEVNRCQNPPNSFRQPEFPSPPEPQDEPMQVDNTRLSSAERLRRLTQRLCLYCGQNGHVIRTCPIRPQRPVVSVVSSSSVNVHPLTTIVQLTTPLHCISVHALLDSGSAGNFISDDLCHQLQLKKRLNDIPYKIQSITGSPLGRGQVRHCVGPIQLRVGQLHMESICLLLLEESTAGIVLGRPWLVSHNPSISWSSREVLKWGNECFPECFPNLPRPISSAPMIPVNSTSIESPLENRSIDVPKEYAHFSEVFCPKRASKLPPHRPWDCAIDLLPDEPVPRGKIYSLSIPEQKAMEEYIEEALQQGYIHPSTSPAASSFFFVAKKDGGLRPCIDYRALNKITIKYRYPLPLVPSALEQLRGARIFTKLDLRSAYNLIRICEGDEWKTAFVTPTGHYEYLVMPYGLVNAPSVFQGYMNEVFRDYLHRFVLVYINDILVYSRNEAEHRLHISEVLQRLR